MDKIRTLIVRAVEAKHASLREASLAIGRNQTYLHQFITYEKPKVLPEQDRLKLARWLGLEETRLRQVPSRTAPRGNAVSAPGGLSPEAMDTIAEALDAAIRERGVTLGAAERAQLISDFLRRLQASDAA